MWEIPLSDFAGPFGRTLTAPPSPSNLEGPQVLSALASVVRIESDLENFRRQEDSGCRGEVGSTVSSPPFSDLQVPYRGRGRRRTSQIETVLQKAKTRGEVSFLFIYEEASL